MFWNIYRCNLQKHTHTKWIKSNQIKIDPNLHWIKNEIIVGLEVDQLILVRRPDQLLNNRKKRTCPPVDSAAPANPGVKIKQNEKIWQKKKLSSMMW